MQVSQMSDAVTHAVLGKKESVEMGVSDSAALMHIFSTALYTYPKLATVREIICNGWDGHIVSKCTDKALSITVDDKNIVIRDYGPGIPHEKIGPIYGVFGNSTKRDDDSVTGGFGLGSKAPFSYTDNFEVVSHHAGVKSIYRVSKSSMEKGGKPTIDTIVQIPTEESGIRVTIPLKTPHDTAEFIRLIREVLILGEIQADLNGERVIVLPTAATHTGYIINSFHGTLTQKINLRYGNVVYPIPRMEHYGEMWDQVTRNMQQLWSQANIIFLAEPDTITIAPSREALIFTEATVETVKGLLAKFNPKQAEISKQVNGQVNRTQVNKLIRNGAPAKRTSDLTQEIELPAIKGAIVDHEAGIWAYELRRAALHEMLSRRSLIYKEGDMVTKKFHHAVHTLPGMDKLLGKAFLKAGRMFEAVRKKASGIYGYHGRYARLRPESILKAALDKHITGPLVRAVKATECMDLERLTYVYEPYADNSTIRFINPWKQYPSAVHQLYGYAFKRVLLARSQTAIKEFMDAQYYTHGDKRRTGWVIYQLPNHEKHYEDIKAVFKKLGYDVHMHIPARALATYTRTGSAEPKEKSPKKPTVKRKGYLTLTSSYDGEDFLLTTARTKCKPEDHTFDPVAYVVLNPSTGRSSRFSDFETATACRQVCKILGHQIAVVTTSQVVKFTEKGIPEVSQYVTQYVDDTLSSAPDFRRYLAFTKYFNTSESRRGNGVDGILRNLCLHKELSDTLDFPFRFTISPETMSLVTFFEDDSTWGVKRKLMKCLEVESKIKMHDQVTELRVRLKTSPWASYLNLHHIGEALENMAPGDEKLAVPYQLTRNLLKEVPV